MSNVRCYGLPAEEQNMRDVFLTKEQARSSTGGDYREIEVEGRRFFVAEWAKWDHKEQKRVAIEIMYHLLVDNGTPIGKVDIDRHRVFCTRESGDSKTKRLSGMPTVDQIYFALREGLGYYQNNGSRRVCQTDLSRALEEALP